jgi:prepilin-type N-terminal cleavage/methylation domain-containing protein
VTRQRGFTLIEMLISLVMVGIVMTGAVRFFRSVSGAVTTTADRMDAMQNLRFGISALDREIRSAGAGTVEIQPTLVYLGPDVVVFNADLVSRIPGSPTAVYYNPDADPASDEAVQTSKRFTIPTTSVTYPDSTYRTTGGQLSPAETIVFYFVPDTATSRPDDYVLMKQVNGLSPEVVSRNLLPYPGRPFFDWQRVNAAGDLVQVPAGSLPWRHSLAVHGSLADTGAVAQIDSVRAVQVNVFATNGQTGSREIRRALVTTIRIPNAGLSKQRSCGDAPIFGRAVTATFTGDPAVPKVTLLWTPAVDETGGETDIERYVIYRRTLAGAFEDALQSIPAGQASYTFDDASVLNDSTYVYGVTALDCTPLESPMMTSAAVVVPPSP